MFTFIRKRGNGANLVTFSQTLLPLGGVGALLVWGAVTMQNSAIHIVLYYYLLVTLLVAATSSLVSVGQRLQKNYRRVVVGGFTMRWAGWVFQLPIGALGGIVLFFWV